MRRVLAACGVSAVLGGAFASWHMSQGTAPFVAAQDQVAPPRVSAPDVESSRRRSLTSDRTSTIPADDLTEFTAEERVNIQVYERTNRSVVNIRTKVPTQESFFGLESEADGAGSGSVLDKNGHILTNFHVIDGASQIAVTLFNGEEYEAGLVGRDPVNDVAVLRISAPPEMLIPIEFGDSSRLRVGQRVLAIGNPFGLERTLTVGTLSSLNRKLPSRASGREIKSVIQIDAALNRGNSGGPLLNTRGLLIGMNTAIASQTGQNTGVGFAVPINTIRRIVPQLIEHGRVIRPFVGITNVYESESGLQIIEVTPGGPADRAGLRGFRWIRKRENRGLYTVETRALDRSQADTIIGVDGQPIRTGDELLDKIESKKPGDRVLLRVLREGREVDISVVLGASE